ncbi:MAG: glycosyltransferase [bacterium]
MHNKENIKIIGVSIGSYPYGTARSIRNMTLLKGMEEKGYYTEMQILYPEKNQDSLSNKIQGIYNGVKFHYQHSTSYNSNILIRLFAILKQIFSFISYINKEHKRGTTPVILNFITHPLITSLITLPLSKKKSILLFHEITEFPFTRVKKLPLLNKLYYKYTLPNFDKVFVINKALKNYFQRFIKPEKLTILNMFVDPSRFEKSYPSPFNFGYIAYCGSMSTDKDGVHILIDAFSQIESKYPELYLVLIGDTQNREVHPAIKNAIKNNNISSKIIFTGQVNNEDMPKHLNNAKLLALARPDNLKAKGGFPTKLGEYLATGRPTLVTKVGEIPNFLAHEVNAYLSEPNAKDFAKQIENILSNYKKAINIAEEGKKIVYKNFNYKEETKKIEGAIKENL